MRLQDYNRGKEIFKSRFGIDIEEYLKHYHVTNMTSHEEDAPNKVRKLIKNLPATLNEIREIEHFFLEAGWGKL